MESVPDIVQHIAVTADHQERQHQNCHDLFPNPNPAGTQKRSDQHQRQYAACQIRQTVLGSRFMKADEICRQRPPVFIKLHRCRERIVHAMGQLQCVISGYQHDCRQRSAQQRTTCHCQCPHRQLFPAKIAHTQTTVGDHCKDAGEHADIEVCEQRQPQCNAVQLALSVPHQIYQSQHYQRQQGDCIQPDDIPVVPQNVAAQSVHHRKDTEGKIISPECAAEKAGEKQAGKADFQQQYQCYRITQKCFRHQCRQQVQRTGSIVGKNRYEVGTQAGIPCIQQRTSMLQFFMQQPQERVILMPEIHHQNLLISKRVHVLQHKPYRQKQHGDTKRQQQKNAALLTFYICLRKRRFHR